MAVSRLGKGAGNRATGTSATLGTSWASFSIATSDANTVAIVAVNCSISTNATTTISATYGGVAMTQYSLVNTGTTSTTRGAAALFYLFNPGTGSKTVAITTSGATKTQVAGIDVAFSGVDTTIGSAQTATTTTHSVTSTASGYSLRVLSNGNALTSPNQTSEYLAGAAVTGQGDYISVQSAVGTGSAISFTCTGTALTPNSIGVDLSPYVPAAAISTLTDDFNTGSTPNAAKWNLLSGTETLSSGELLLPASSGDVETTPVGYNFTGDGMYIQATAAVADILFFVFSPSTSYSGGWYFNSSSQVEVHHNGAGTGTTRTHTQGDWYRFRESGGTAYWDYSSNGTSWTNLYSTSSAAMGVGRMYVQIYGVGVSGTARFDNFNTAPAPSNTGAFFAMF